MKARYIATSDPTDDQTCTAFGQTFEKDKWITVADEIGDRLAGNPTFETKGGAPDPEAEPPAAQA